MVGRAKLCFLYETAADARSPLLPVRMADMNSELLRLLVTRCEVPPMHAYPIAGRFSAVFDIIV